MESRETLQTIVGKSPFIAQGKITDAKENKEPDLTSYWFKIQLTRAIFGDGPVKEVGAIYAYIRPGYYPSHDKNGNRQIEELSPVYTGSGLEEKAQVGEEYIFFFSENKPESGSFDLLRIEPVEKMDEVVKLIDNFWIDVFWATVDSIKPLEGKLEQAYMVALDPRWLLALHIQQVLGDRQVLDLVESDVLFAIHSPAKLFKEEAKKVVGRSYAFELTRTKKMPATTRYALEVFPWLVTDEDIHLYDAIIVNWGMYEIIRDAKKDIHSVVTGDTFVVSKATLLEQTDRIPAKKGICFGFNYVLKGFHGSTLPRMKIRVKHPPIVNPHTKLVQTESFWEDNAWIGSVNYHTSWIFDYDDELVPGSWVIQLFYKEQKLLEKKFQVVLK